MRAETAPERQGIDATELAALDRAGQPDGAPVEAMPSMARRGRGATTNPPVRFDPRAASPFDDGWDTLSTEFGELPPLPTTLIRDSTRSAIAWNSSPDIGFDRAVNPYRGLRARLHLLLCAPDATPILAIRPASISRPS